MMKGLKFKNKKAASFGSYGWSGEAVKLINTELTKAGFELVNEGLKLTWNPDETQREEAIEFGRNIGSSK